MSAPELAQSEQASAPFEAPPEDINAIGRRERSFPIALFVCGAMVIVLLIAGATYWIKSAAPFATTKKEDYPIKTVPEPLAGAAKLEIADASISPPDTPDPASPVVVPAPTAAKTPRANGDGLCPSTAVIDKQTQRPVTDARGVPVTVDCRGVYSNAQPGASTPRASASSPAIPGTNESLAAVVTDRYLGEAILSRQLPAKQDKLPALGTMPQLPAPPVGASEVLRQLQALQTGQAQLGSAPTANPLPVPGAAARLPAGASTPFNTPADKTDRAFAVKAIDENLVIPKGAQIDCGLTTRTVTDNSGFASCLVSRDVYSANGRVLLIERMSVLDGEYVAQSQAGQRFIHILWTRVRKPGGATIEIASPATDGLGGAGIPAFVDNRWMERIGGAYLLSFIKDAITYKTAVDAQTGQSAAAGVAYQNSVKTSESLAEKVLSTTIGIKPLLYANQGDRVAVYVARDLDFSKIYEVRTK